MKWTRAVWHLETLAQTCAEMITKPTSIFPLRVEQLWAFGDILGSPRELDTVSVALVVDRPVQDIPWLDEPNGAQHWSSATRLTKSPIVARWRSMHAPLWNHRIDRPVMLWSESDGIAEAVLEELRAGRGPALRPAPVPASEYRQRLAAELAVSLSALEDRTGRYEDRRWKPGKLEPVADALWRVSAGYLEVEAAVRDMNAG